MDIDSWMGLNNPAMLGETDHRNQRATPGLRWAHGLRRVRSTPPERRNMQNAPIPEPTDELKEIYRQLRLGMAHERVNDDNVFTLIDMAARNGDTELETL